MLALPALRLLSRHPRQGLLRGRRAVCAAAENGGKITGPGQKAPLFDTGLLEILVCPLSKKPLRYNDSTSELINEELGIAYPIIDGIPNMIPQAARMVGKEKQETESEQT